MIQRRRCKSQCDHWCYPFSTRSKDGEKCGNRRYFLLTFTKLQFVKDGGFTGGIKSDHKDSHLLLAELHYKERTKDKDRKHT